jgi:nucleoporin SEH1
MFSRSHPEFGQILASSSTDRAVHIYEEQLDSRGSANLSRVWKKQSRLVDSRDSVVDLSFSPRHLGLRLATASADGRVRIYESNDIMNLSVWPLIEEFEAAKANLTAIQWNSSPFDPAQLVVAAENTVKIWEFQAKLNKWVNIASLEGHNDIVNDVVCNPILQGHKVALFCCLVN